MTVRFESSMKKKKKKKDKACRLEQITFRKSPIQVISDFLTKFTQMGESITHDNFNTTIPN